MAHAVTASQIPDRNCPLCPRLVEFREEARARHPDWFNSPVPAFGDAKARLLIVGLAPGMQGANRTGRPFTGDYAGDLLYATLLEYGFAKGTYQARPDDGLRLVNCRIGNAVHCLPPQNKPLPAEINTCRQFLIATIAGTRFCAIKLSKAMNSALSGPSAPTMNGAAVPGTYCFGTYTATLRV